MGKLEQGKRNKLIFGLCDIQCKYIEEVMLMRFQDLENVIKEENLDGANICNATSLQPYQVVITQEEGVWKVYNTDERAGLWGIVSCFDSEAEACEDFIKKLRFHKRLSELQKEIWKKRK